MPQQPIDIKENDILAMSTELLNTLLKDHTLSTEECQVNIFWATDNYADRGPGFQYGDQITIESITGENGNVIVPRATHERKYGEETPPGVEQAFLPATHERKHGVSPSVARHVRSVASKVAGRNACSTLIMAIISPT